MVTNGKYQNNFESFKECCPEIYKHGTLLEKSITSNDLDKSFEHAQYLLKKLLDKIYKLEKIPDTNNIYDRIEKLSNMGIIPWNVTQALNSATKELERGFIELSEGIILSFFNYIKSVLVWFHKKYYGSNGLALTNQVGNLAQVLVKKGGKVSFSQNEIYDKDGNIVERNSKVDIRFDGQK